MPLLRTVSLLCLHCYLLCIVITQTSCKKYTSKTQVLYKISDYFYDSNYVCYTKTLFPKKQRQHLRRCKLDYSELDNFSPSCIFCPIPCSLCSYPVEYYTFDSLLEKMINTKKVPPPYKCHFHSLDRIEPKKIRSKKGVTYPEDVKCAAKNYCKKSPCQNHGTCINMYYSYVCICPKEFYGKTCSNKAPDAFAGKLTHGVQLWFPLQSTAGFLFPFFITVAHEGEAQVIELTTQTGYTIRLQPKDKIKDFPAGCKTIKAGKCNCNENTGCKSAYKGTLIADNYHLKAKFDYLPAMGFREQYFAFITNITMRVFNQKFNPKKPVLEETFQAFTKLRFQTVFFWTVHPVCACQTFTADNLIKGDCMKSFSDKVPIKADSKVELYFTPIYVQYGWQLYKMASGDKGVGDAFKSKPQICSDSTLFKFHWRFYKIDGLYKMTDESEKMKLEEESNLSCKETPNSDEKQKCEVKITPKIKSGDYMLRLTLQTYAEPSGTIQDNFQVNYYCYFHVEPSKKELIITGDAIINKCLVNIDTKGYDGEGELIWTCTVKKGGPCPPEVGLNSNKVSLSKVNFKDGEYEICIDWEISTTSISKPCVQVEAKDCDKKKPAEPDYVVDCKQNCGLNPDPTVPVRVGVIDRNTGKVPEKVSYRIVDNDGHDIPLSNVTIPSGVRENEIKIDLSKLTPGVTYEVIGKVGNIETPPYPIKYKNIEIPKDGNCTVTPMSGMKGVTLFDIECFGWQTEGPIVYEFFDKGAEDIEHYQGRMIAYSYSGILSQFRLTRGKVVIYILNEDGDGPSVNLTVELTDFNSNISHIDYLMKELDSFMGYDNFQRAMDIMSTTAEILYKDLNNDYYIRKLITTMYKVTYNSAESMKLGISTILSILSHGTLKGTYLLDDVLEKYTGKILTGLAWVYLKYAVKPGNTPRLRANHINQLSRNIMDCVDMTMIAQDKNVTKLGPEEDINYDVIDNLNIASNDFAEALMIAMYLVGRFHGYAAPGEQLISTEGVTDMWAWVNSAQGLVNAAGSNLSSFANISDELAKSLDPDHDIMLQFSLMNKNVFWWAKDNINTEVLMVGLAEKLYRPGFYYVPRVPHPVQIFMKVQNLEKTTVTGTATQLDPDLDEDTLDRNLLVHRFFLPPLSKLFITFNFNNLNSSNTSNSSDTANTSISTTASLRVQVYYNVRPDWESMSDAPVVSSENPEVVMPYDTVEREHFYYMGILPDKSVPVNESVDYSFDVHFINCHVWQNQWVNHYCLVGPKTSVETVECQCTHLSVFSSSIFIPPNDINPVLDAPLFLTVLENPWVVIFVIVIILLFLLLLIWAFKKDKRDALCSDVIVLHDNFPGESYAYLIAIFTGSRLTSGTSAVVGLRLYGDIYASRPTVLKSETRKVLQRDQDDWFLLCYPVSLGMLNAVQLWHNNTGRSPDWYCSKIIVYDLEAKTQYLFIVDQWLAMEVDEFPEAMVRPATSDEVMSVKRVFLDNSVLGLRENHLHLSVFARHPRSPVARKQRLIVLMVLVMSAMMSSIMFFKVTDNFDETVDEFRYSFGNREFIISIQTLIFATVISFIAMFLFRKSYVQKEVHKHRSTLFMPRKRSDESDVYWLSQKPVFVDLSTFIAYDEKPVKHRKDMTMYEAFIASIRHCTHQKVLRPVHLATKGSEIQVKKGWLIAAWTFSIVLIIVFAYMIMLYSLKFGKIKSLKWLSSLVASQVQEIFIIAPLKIILVAILLSIAFERTTDISAFKLDVNEAVKHDLVGNKQYLDDLVELRKADTYYPMTDEVKAKKRRKTMRKTKWRIICDFFAVLTYILILCYIMRILWSGSHYQPNTHAKDIMMTKYHGRFIALEDVYNRTQFFSYLQNTFVRSLFVFRWFDDLNFKMLSPPDATERKDWAKDYVSKMLGAPRLRQLRVSPGRCTVHQMMLVALKECNSPWSTSHMDTDTYGVQWSKAQLEDELTYAWGYRTYWMYRKPANTSVFPVSGKSGTVYPSGGYILPLAVKRESSKSYAIQVEQEHWIDQRTRGVFLELTLYNTNSHLYSQVTAIIEQMTSGLFMTIANVDSVKTRDKWSVWNVIYIIFIEALFIRILYRVNRNGMINYFKKLLNVYEIIVIAVGILSVVCYLIHIKVSTYYVEEFHSTGQDHFFNFKDMIKYFSYTKVFLWVLFCLLVFRLFVSWYFGPAYVSYYNTFVLSKRWIVIMMVSLLFYFVIIWRVIGYTIDAKIFYNYRVTILHYKMYTDIYNREFQSRTKMVALALCFLVLFFKVIFFTMFAHYYQIGKRKKLLPMQYFNFLTFAIDEIKRCFGKKKEETLSDRLIHRKRDMKTPRMY